MSEISAEQVRDLKDAKPRVVTETSSINAVMIAEDDLIFRRILESWFKKWDYQVTAVENGVDAWEVLQRDNAPQLAYSTG